MLRSPSRPELAVVAGMALFVAAWALLHQGWYARDQIVDVGVYERYGVAVEEGDVPYRDFDVEYPPLALPVFVAPALVSVDSGGFRTAFESLMAVCGAALVGFVALASRSVSAAAFAALAPLLLGSVILTRFDLWPAMLTAAALAALVAGRRRLGFLALGAAVAAKLYGAVLLPVAVAYVWRREGRAAALRALALSLAVVAASYLPFLLLSPGGVAHSVAHQASRPIQIESLPAALYLAAHHLFGVEVEMVPGHGSQNLAGPGSGAAAVLFTLVQLGVLVAAWTWFARGPATPRRLVVASAASLAAFVAFGKVLSPQFLIWLIPAVALAGRAAWALLAAALVLTQIWFPYRYWELARELDETVSWLVLARDLVLVALAVALVRALRREPARSA